MTYVLTQVFGICYLLWYSKFDATDSVAVIISMKGILLSVGANFGPKFNDVWWSDNAMSVRLVIRGLTYVVVIYWLFLLLDVVWS